MTERTLITAIEGPKGKAEVWEHSEEQTGTAISGVASSTYELVCGHQKQTTRTPREASLAAPEFAAVASPSPHRSGPRPGAARPVRSTARVRSARQ